MGHVALLGTGVVTASNATGVVTLTAGVFVGQTALGAICWESASGAIPTISSIVDTRGNSWVSDIGAGGASNVTDTVRILRGTITTALQVGDTITVTVSATRSSWAMQYDSFDDINSTPLDQTQHADNSTGTALTTGATLATAQSYELCYAAFGFNGARTATIQPGWFGTAQVSSGGTTNRAVQAVYQYTSAAATQTATLTLDTSSVYCGAIATYKATPRRRQPYRVAAQSVNRAAVF